MNNPGSYPSFYCLWDIPLLLDSLQYSCISYTIGPTDLIHPYQKDT